MGVEEDDQMLKREVTEYEKRVLASKTDSLKKARKGAFGEFIGTMFVVFFCISAQMAAARYRGANAQSTWNANTVVNKFENLPHNNVSGSDYFISTSLGMGMCYAVCNFIFYHISGAHCNPIITMSLLLVRKCSIPRCVVYIVAQFAGAMLGGGFLLAIAADIRVTTGETQEWKYSWQGSIEQGACFGANYLNKSLTGVTEGQCFLVELLGGFWLLLAYNALTDYTRSNQSFAPLGVGMSYFVYNLIAVPLYGGGLNPFKSIVSVILAMSIDLDNGNPAYMCDSEIFAQLWIFLFGPFVGAMLGTVGYEYFFSADKTIKATLDISKYKPKGATAAPV